MLSIEQIGEKYSDNVLEWLQSWYSSRCDGLWEHAFGIELQNIDNPGWFFEFDLGGYGQNQYSDIVFFDIEMESEIIDKDSDDWIYARIKDNKLRIAGGKDKLTIVIAIFRYLISENIVRVPLAE